MKLFFIIIIFISYFAHNSFAQQYSCDYKVEVLVNGTEFEKENFKWKMMATRIEGASTNITGTAEILDSKGNIIKKYRPWTDEAISRQKTSSEYSPNLKEGEEYMLKAEINAECDDANKNNNFDNKLIRIKQAKTEGTLADKENETNNNIGNAETNVIGNAENIANNSVTGISTQNNETKNEQNASMIQKIDLKEEAKGEDEDNVIRLKEENAKNPLTADDVQETKAAYESSNEKSRNLIIFFILGISVILNIVLIWRR